MGKNYENYSSQDFLKDEFFWLWAAEDNPEANQFWKSFLLSHPEKFEEVEEARSIIGKLNSETEEISTERIKSLWGNIHSVTSEIQDEDINNEQLNIYERAPRHIPFITLLKVAAVFVGVILSAVFYFTYNSSSLTQVKTDYNQNQTVILPDHSKVILNSNSAISYRDDWSTDSIREVWLQGEALFQVKHLNKHQKFIVYVNNIQVKVIGTTFNIHSRHGKTKVVLREGKVNLKVLNSQKSQDLQMKPGEMVEVSIKDKKVSKKKVNPKFYTSWTEKKLIFRETTLKEIASILEDSYGYQVIVQDENILNLQFTGTVPTNNLNILLEGLKEVHHLSINKEDHAITIKR